MRFLLQIVKRHPFSIVGFVLYLLLCVDQIRTERAFRAAANHINSGNRIAWGEGVIYGYLFVILMAFVLIIAVLIRAAFRKEEIRFYVFLCSGIVLVVMMTCAF
jgi:hypothetical protein